MKPINLISRLLPVVLIGWVCTASAQTVNIALQGTGIIGVKTAIDGSPGTPRISADPTTVSNINDGDITSSVDDWWAGGEANGAVSYVGVVWPTTRYDAVTNLVVTFHFFSDGGWFGVPGLTPSGTPQMLSAATNLVEPTLQVTTNYGASWTTATHSSDYLTAVDGVVIPGSATANFILTPPATQINGVRLIGTNGGVGSDTNGFLGIYELEIDAYPPVDTDGDGLPDAWMIRYFGHSDPRAADLSRASDDPDGDGLTNLQEYTAGTNPKNTDTDGDGLSDAMEVNTTHTSPVLADTDGDGLSDGAEVNTYHTDPLLADTDGDGLSDGAEVLIYHSNPLVVDTDGDGFPDGMEVAYGTDPTDPAIFPSNFALIGTGILGTKVAVDSGAETAVANAGSTRNINDGDLTTRVDTWNNAGTDTASFVGIVWNRTLTNPIVRLELTLATFLDGGWFGPNNAGPGPGGFLTPAYLTEPIVQVSSDGGATWTNVPHVSDYMTVMNGHGIGGGAYPNPSSVTAAFTITNSTTGTSGVSGINGIRLIGSEGGTASGGFLGVFELGALIASNDSDHDGMPDDWERLHGLIVGVNDAGLDPDNDGLTNLEEYRAGTDPHVADTDGDGLSDGEEVKIYHTDPLRIDTDSDGLTDGAEVLIYHTNPLVKDTDGDGFNDGIEVRLGSDPTNPNSYPDDFAPLGAGILGTKQTVDSGAETLYYHAGGPGSINDADLTTSVDTYNGGTPSEGDTASFVGIVWDHLITNPIVRLELSLATFFDGGWFGVNNVTPGAGGVLTAADNLLEPVVQVSTDGGTNWTTVPHTSDYLTALDGHPLPAVAFGAPTLGTANFQLSPPQTNINGIRLLGSEGGVASGGFLGVFELAVHVTIAPQPVRLLNPAKVSGQFQFQFQSQNGVNYVVQFRNSLTAGSWQTLTNITGDGTLKQVTDTLGDQQRFYRVANQ